MGRALVALALVAAWSVGAAPQAQVDSVHVEAAQTDSAQVDRVVVDKGLRVLLLMHGDTIVRSYRVALGRRPTGDKRCRGDNRTPEGTYVIDGRNAVSRYHRSLHISYPDSADVAAARKRGCRPGGDIMIHGLPRMYAHVGASHAVVNWTQGCIAVTNEEIEEIWDLVPDGTPVEIMP